MGQLFTGSIAIRGIRGPIPSGYILGRTDSGSGPPQLISLPVLGQKMMQSGIPVTRLSSLQDVAFSTLTDKQHLEYNATAGKWVNVAPPALSTLTDVVEAAPANGQVLTFEVATNKWKNKNPTANQVNNYLGPTTVGLTSFQPGIGATLTHGNWGGVPALISAGMNVTDIRFYATAAAASAVVTPAIYADNAGAPGALIAVGSATTGVVQGLNSFSCAFAASVDQVVWLGVLVETADIILATCDYKPNAYFAAAGPLPPNTAPTATFQIGTCWASMWADVIPVGITSSPLSSLSPAVLGLVMAASLSTSASLAAAETVGLVMTATLQTGVVTVAASMLLGITLAATLSVSGDAFTVLLLHFDGTNGSTTFTDSSTANHTMTANSSAALSTTQAKFGTASGKFGTTTTDRVTTPDSANFDLSTGDFTIEGFYYRTGTGGGTIIGKRTISSEFTSFNVGDTGSGALAYLLSSTGTGWNIAVNVAMGTVALNTWTHWALVRSGNTFIPFVNGVQGTTTTSSASLVVNTKALSIGGLSDGFSLGGFLDEIRISKGVARYTSGFTPPAAPFTP